MRSRRTTRADSILGRPRERLVGEGKFREDLDYRIRVVEVEIPPLRVRGADEIDQLARQSPFLVAAPVVQPQATVTIPLGRTLDDATGRYVEATLESCDNNKAETARRLAVGRNTTGRMFSRDSDPGDPSGDD